MKKRGYIYGLFRCEYDTKTKEVTATFPDWQEPIFLTVQWIYGLMSEATDTEPTFPIKFYK